MGWGERIHVMVELDMEHGLARITPTDDKAQGWALTKNKTALQGILPIPHKGSSRWGEAWIPVVAPIAGAIVGAFLFKVLFA